MNQLLEIIGIIASVLGILWLVKRPSVKPYESKYTKEIEQDKQKVEEAHEKTNNSVADFNELARKFRERFKR